MFAPLVDAAFTVLGPDELKQRRHTLAQRRTDACPDARMPGCRQSSRSGPMTRIHCDPWPVFPSRGDSRWQESYLLRNLTVALLVPTM